MAFDDTGSDTRAQAARPRILALEPDRMRALGYQAVDALVDHYRRLDARPVGDWQEPGATLTDLPRGFPEAPQDPGATLALALEQVFGHGMQVTHPRFFAYIPSPGNFVSALGDFLASGFNVFGRRVIRLCPIHPECTERDLDETLARLERLAGQLLDGEGV